MALQSGAIEALAPDRSALVAALGLLKPTKWPVRGFAADLVWGECQGSGANPYRVAADMTDGAANCTCPSRKFPCKHGLALMLMRAQNGPDFTPGTIPDWVTEWQGRRRKTPAANRLPDAMAWTAPLGHQPPAIQAPAPVDAAAEARKREAASKRARETRRSVQAGTDELESWIADQVATLPAFLAELPARCRRIAARLVD